MHNLAPASLITPAHHITPIPTETHTPNGTAGGSDGAPADPIVGVVEGDEGVGAADGEVAACGGEGEGDAGGGVGVEGVEGLHGGVGADEDAAV